MVHETSTFAEIKNEDKKYIEQIIEKLYHEIWWNEDYAGWFIKEQSIEDYLYNEENTIINPKELGEIIEIIIEDEFNIPKDNSNLADRQADYLDILIKDCYPDDEFY